MTDALSYDSDDLLLARTSQRGQVAGLNAKRVANTLDTGLNAGGNTDGLGAIFGNTVAQNLTQASDELGMTSQQTMYQAMTMFNS